MAAEMLMALTIADGIAGATLGPRTKVPCSLI